MSFDNSYFDISTHWNHYDDEARNQVIDNLIEQGCYINSDTPLFLRMNKRYVLKSLEQYISLARYIPEEMLNDSDVFKILASHYCYSPWQIKRFSIDKILDKEVMNCFLEQTDSYGNDNPIYRERLSQFLHDALHRFPSIATFHKIFDAAIEEAWIEHKNNNSDKYQNVFAKICSYLRNNKVISNFDKTMFGVEIKEGLGSDRYRELCSAMKNYIRIYHGNGKDKIKKIQRPKEVISNLSALYISKCKETYKKKKMEQCSDFLRCFYTLNLSNPVVYEKVSHYCKRRKFKDLYRSSDPKISSILRKIEKKYKDQVDMYFIHTCIHHFLVYGYNDFTEIMPIGRSYFSYLDYKKCLKLIHRLNNKYILYDGPELNSYRHLIKFDNKSLQYVYIGETFSDKKIENYEEYIGKERIFNHMKRDLSFMIDQLDLKEEEITESDYSHFSQKVPFNDDYFQFDFQAFYKYLDIENFIRIMLNKGNGFEIINFLNDASYQKMYKILIDEGVFWLRLLLSRYRISVLTDYGFNLESITNFINHMDKIVSLSNDFHIDISNINQFMLFQKMVDFIDLDTLAIFKTDTILSLLENTEFTPGKKKRILLVAKELFCHMVSRNYSTVPYIEGSYLDYQYSLYDSLDEELLLAGINTDACFKCCGNDNDFLHYCALNKNGFVLKISDSSGNFIGRAAGFRHGNCVFFNQLRTIYDRNGNYYLGRYGEEKRDIINTFKKACESIVTLSQNNKDEKVPIDYVFVNKSYALGDRSVSTISNLEYAIGSAPMDMTSENWSSFIKNTKYLQESDIGIGFETDYGGYPIICLAASNDKEIENNLEFCDIEAIYKRKRNSIVVTEHPTFELVSKINKIKAIYSFLKKEAFDLISEDDGDLFAVGDNWYILYKNNRLVEQCVLFEDEIALIEASTTDEEISRTFDLLDDEKNKVYQKQGII